jgi:hypothetical protein
MPFQLVMKFQLLNFKQHQPRDWKNFNPYSPKSMRPYHHDKELVPIGRTLTIRSINGELMKNLLCVISLLGSLSAMASELESGKYEQTVERSRGHFSCEYKVINAKNEDALYLTMSNCYPKIINFKLESQDGINYSGKQTS